MYHNYDNEIEQLIYIFSKLPGLGTRSAQRIVLHLMQDKDIRLKSLTKALSSAYDKITICNICNNICLATICSICASNDRDPSTIAIVETVLELWAMEKSEVFKGHYHVLTTNKINSRQSQYESLGLGLLMNRCKNQNAKELIIATNTTPDGQTIAYLISEYFKDFDIRLSKLANGIPIGGELDYLDGGTLLAALKHRHSFE
ncbi:MAG: recombination mediator RecR [Rickettsiaceae bacterium]